MALPVTHPLDEVRMACRVPSVSSTSIAYIVAPFRGKVIKVGAVIAAAISTADATCTTSIAGTAITGGAFTVTQSGSAAGNVATATPTAVNTCNEDDAIAFTWSGSGTAGTEVTCFAVIRRA